MTAIFLALFLSSFDLTSAGRSLRAADLALITLAVVINLSAYLIRAWRWRYLLSPVRRGLGMYTLTSATFIGYMVTFVVPFRLGEIVRPVLVARRERLSASAAIATIAVERMMDLLTVVTLFVVFLLTGHGARLMAAASGRGGNGAAGFVETGLVAAGVLGAIAIPLMAILVIAPGRVTDLLYRINPGAPGGFLARGIGLVRHFASGLRVLRGGRELVMSLLLSFAMWLVIDLSIFVGVRAIGLVDRFLGRRGRSRRRGRDPVARGHARSDHLCGILIHVAGRPRMVGGPRDGGPRGRARCHGGSLVKCPFCTYSEDKVVDSREAKDGAVIRRRRECLGCHRRFTSYERIDEIPVMVIKKDGKREPFDRNKVLAGLRRACEKRPVSPVALEAIADEVEQRLQDSSDREIPAGDIGEVVIERLKELDKVAYVRFASVYRQFEDVDQFMKELKGLLSQRK